MLRRTVHTAFAALLVLQVLPAPIAVMEPASAAPSTVFGSPGSPQYANYRWASGATAQEPSIGVAWTLPGGIDRNGQPDFGTTAMYQSGVQQHRLDFNDAAPVPTMTRTVVGNVNSGNAGNVVNGDPLLFTDHRTGRTFAGGWIDVTAAAVPLGWIGCAAMMYTDNNGGTNGLGDWKPMGDVCSIPAGDHPSIGAGPAPVGYQPRVGIGMYPHLAYYCAQGSLSSITVNSDNYCWVSEDGGLTWLPGATPDPRGNCWAFNGRIRVGPEGRAYLPHYRCSGLTSLLVTSDGARTWSLRTLNFPNSGTGDFDPSVAPTLESGWIYVGQAERDCACVALSKDGGLTWEDQGQGNGAAPGTKYFNVATQAFDLNGNPVTLRRFNFAHLVAGDDERAAFAFLGATGNAAPGTCNAALEWHLYVATTFDAGKTWTAQQASDDPVQRGGIWSGGAVVPASTCRNLLDFNDAVIDRYGRVLVAYTDGCPNPCATPLGGQSTGAMSAVARQYTGCGLLKVRRGSRDVHPGAHGQVQAGVPALGAAGDPDR
jgi:hypothetical protein